MISWFNNILRFAFLSTIFFAISCTQSNQSPSPVSFMVFGEPAELQAFQSLVDAFQTKHADIPIELIHIPSQGDYRSRVSADIAAGDPADVVLINYRRFPGLALKNAFEPLGPYLDGSDKIKYEDFYTITMRAFSINDQVVCIPQNISSLVMYYNKDLFDAAGLAYPSEDWKWDDFISAAQALTLDTPTRTGRWINMERESNRNCCALRHSSGRTAGRLAMKVCCW